MLCGLGAGVAEATLVVTWIETLKVRLIADQRRKEPRFRGLFHAASTIVKEEVGTKFETILVNISCYLRESKDCIKDQDQQ